MEMENSETSQLYSDLKPIGLGSPFSESLSSYMANIAYEHSMSVGKLLDKIISPKLGKHYLSQYSIYGGTGFYKSSQMINGVGQAASDFVCVMEGLTSRSDIKQLTLINLQTVFPSRGLLKQERAWCPCCYNDWRISNSKIYDPLLWVVRAMDICPIHKVPLRTVCPQCHRKLPVLDRNYRPGWCSRCGYWLGEGINSQSLAEWEEVDEWTANNLIEVISCLPSYSSTIGQAANRSLNTLVSQAYQGNIAEFARNLQVPKTTAWGWISGKNMPTIQAWLAISFSASVKLVDLLAGAVLAPSAPKPISISLLKHTQRPPLRQRLEVANQLISSDIGTLTLKKVCQQADIDKKTLKVASPRLCESLRSKLTDQLQLRPFKLAELKQEIETITRRLLEVGVYPSRRRVEQLGVKAGLLRSPITQRFWKSIIHRRIKP